MSTAQQTAPELTYKKGRLADTYPLFDPMSVQTGAEISFDRIDNPELARVWFYTANVPLFTKKGDKLLYGIGGKVAFNVVFGANTKTVCDELVQTNFVHLDAKKQERIWELAKSGEVVFVNAYDLNLEREDDEFRFFPIRTGRYQEDLTVARIPFVRAGYGEGVNLDKVMSFLNYNPIRNIEETGVGTLNPDYVAENVGDDEMVARASWLNGFGSDSDFGASGRSVCGHGWALRGVPLEKSAEGGAKTNLLETLVGSGGIVHGDIAVVKKSDVSPEDWVLLTQRK